MDLITINDEGQADDTATQGNVSDNGQRTSDITTQGVDLATAGDDRARAVDTATDPNLTDIAMLENRPIDDDASASESDCPSMDMLQWMGPAVDYLLAVEGGDGWLNLVKRWMKLERLLDYPDRDVSDVSMVMI
jgi:hypothetical protein